MKKLIVIASLFISISSIQSQTYISKEQAVEDLDFLNKTLLDVHFNPFIHIEKETYDLEVEKIKSSFQDSIKIKEYIKSLYRITSLMEDSHSNPGIYQAKLFNNDYKKELFFSFQNIYIQ